MGMIYKQYITRYWEEKNKPYNAKKDITKND